LATKFIEPIIGYIDTILQAGMSAKLDVIDAEYGDFTLDDIQDYYQAKKIVIQNYPSIEIYPENSPGIDFTANSVKCEHEVAIRVHAMAYEGDEERLMKRVFRYMRAITELIKATDDLEGDVNICQFAGHEYGDIESLEGGALVYNGIIHFIIDNEETVQ